MPSLTTDRPPIVFILFPSKILYPYYGLFSSHRAREEDANKMRQLDLGTYRIAEFLQQFYPWK